jgi:hypothetical protein
MPEREGAEVSVLGGYQLLRHSTHVLPGDQSTRVGTDNWMALDGTRGNGL